MIEAVISKMAIQPEKGKTIMFAVAEYGTDMMNIRVGFDFDSMDKDLFIEELRDTIAREFGIPVYHVHLQPEVILGKMCSWTDRFREMHLI